VRSAGETRARDWWFGRTTLHVDGGPASEARFHQPYRWSVRPASLAPVSASAAADPSTR
jgi:hypothetical protein